MISGEVDVGSGCTGGREHTRVDNEPAHSNFMLILVPLNHILFIVFILLHSS